jgi:hypothetical protein
MVKVASSSSRRARSDWFRTLVAATLGMLLGGAISVSYQSTRQSNYLTDVASLRLLQVTEISAGTETQQQQPEAEQPPKAEAGVVDFSGSLAKLYQQVPKAQVDSFDRSKPLYLDFGLSDAADTALYLNKGYAAVAVDAFLPWIEKAKKRFESEMAANRLLLFNVGVATEESEAMPLYYKKEGDVIASFVENKGCQNLAPGHEKCLHTDVQVVQCEAVLQFVNKQADIMKVDIEMLHHACIRGLHHLDSSLLPKTVCWEEHDKDFGSAKIPRPVTDVKLILGLYELGYDGIKIVLQGRRAHKFYGIDRTLAGHGQGSGSLTPDEMMHYRSYEEHDDGSFDADWKTVPAVLRQGVFGPGGPGKPARIFETHYFDVCMKLSSTNPKEVRELRQSAENFPLGSYA